jgi:hypothetical protein
MPGEKALVAFSETDIREATVVQYEEQTLPGACDLGTEFLMLDIPGLGVQPLTRHNIASDEDAEWCLTEAGERMVEIVFEQTDILIGPLELFRYLRQVCTP